MNLYRDTRIQMGRSKAAEGKQKGMEENIEGVPKAGLYFNFTPKGRKED